MNDEIERGQMLSEDEHSDQASHEKEISVEVAYATPEKQVILKVNVIKGATMIDAVHQSGILAEFPEIDLEKLKLGIFGKLEAKPHERVLIPDDRVEIYRPLIVDPKEARKKRAEKKELKK